MRRLYHFYGGLTWGARLQLLAVAILLGWWAYWDYKHGYWPVTVGIALFSWVVGWALKRFMAAHPRLTSRSLSAIGIVMFLLYVLAGRKKWWRMLIAHFVRELLLWIDLSCQYWFVSESRLQHERAAKEALQEQLGENRIDHGDRFDFRNDDFGDR